MKSKSYLWSVFFICIAWCITGFSQPDLAMKKKIEDLTILPDASAQDTYYYLSTDLRVVRAGNGRPDFSFVQMRYTGSQATADQGTARFNSILKFKVYFPPVTGDQISRISGLLGSGSNPAVLKPLPLQKLDAELIYATLQGTQNRIFGGFFEASESSPAGIKGNAWTERTFSVRLDNMSSQAFWQAFHQKKTILTVNYSLSGMGMRSDTSTLAFSSGIGTESFENPFSNDGESGNLELKTEMLFSNALSIEIDTRSWPDLLTKVDINQSLPPDYAALDVYCFDFNNALRDDLYIKRLEIQAQGMGKGLVKLTTTFKANQADTYARSLRFPYAVRMDRPLKYRVVEITKNGEIDASDWKLKNSWSEILDITSKVTRPEENDL